MIINNQQYEQRLKKEKHYSMMLNRKQKNRKYR